MLSNFHILAFTHRNFEVNEIGKLHIQEDNQAERLTFIKEFIKIEELMFLSTCNRVEFLICFNPNDTRSIDKPFLIDFFSYLYPEQELNQIEKFSSSVEIYSGLNAVEHLQNVASSIDSMVIGEREIITQVRNAFENCKKMNLTGDFIRLLMRHTIETAKRVYTETSIATKPVSVVSLAYHTLRNLNISLDARILIVGAGVTNTNMGKFLKKHGFKNFSVFNRTFSKAERLARDLNGIAYPLENLKNFNKGFDIIITCTGAEDYIISQEIYKNLLQGENDKKVVIDIAIPYDLDKKILEKHNVSHISIDYLQKVSDQNLKERSKEITHVEEILNEQLYNFQQLQRIRAVEIAMRDVPTKVKEIKSIAFNQVFKNELNSLDENSIEVLEKIIGYMEKKYISMPMKMAKEIMLKPQS
jgi:glutamyl-tRNA reductase